MKIQELAAEYREIWGTMRGNLYGEASAESMSRDFENLLGSHEAGCVLVLDGGERPIGFVEMALRKYVDGCETSPVAYLEGVYVEPEFRDIEAAEAWAIDRGCNEFATDSRLGDADAQRFHQHIGFEETDRIVQFKKSLR